MILDINPLDVIVSNTPCGSYVVKAYIPEDCGHSLCFVHYHFFEDEEAAHVLAARVVVRGNIDINHWAHFVPTEA